MTTQLSLLPVFDKVGADALVMHPTAAELQAQMVADEQARREYEVSVNLAVLTDTPLPVAKPSRARKPRRAPQNVSEATPF